MPRFKSRKATLREMGKHGKAHSKRHAIGTSSPLLNRNRGGRRK